MVTSVAPVNDAPEIVTAVPPASGPADGLIPEDRRLQMIEDQQTHSLPTSVEGVGHVACFMGYGDAEAFAAELRAVLENVQGHYARLFESAPALTSSAGNLVFTGVEEDPETLNTLSAMGFREAAHVSAAIRGWHHGRYRAMRSVRAAA